MAKRLWVSIEARLDRHSVTGEIAATVRKPRLYVVGALAKIWGVCLEFGRADGEDVILSGYTIYDVDGLAGCKGFAAALLKAGWISVAGATDLRFIDLAKPLLFGELRKARDRFRKSKNGKNKADIDESARNFRGISAEFPPPYEDEEEQPIDTTNVVSTQAPSEKPVKFREPDPIWDAICQAYGLNPTTKPEGSRVGRLVRDLKVKLATPADIATRAARWRSIHPEDRFNTPEALVKHWDELAKEPSNGTTGLRPGKIGTAADRDEYDAAAKRSQARALAGVRPDHVPSAADDAPLLRGD